MFIRPGKTVGPDLSDEGTRLKALPHTHSPNTVCKV